MSEIIAGIEIPETSTAAEATRFIRESTSPLLFHHSRRVFLFGSLHARALGLRPDPELLYVAALFHDTGLLRPYSEAEQRFEVDGADHAGEFLRTRGFSPVSIELVWSAIALHTTPGIPARLGPEIAATNLGVLTDAIGVGLEDLDAALVEEITAAHPRGDFKNQFLQTFHEGLRHRPDTTYGTINADILEHFVPGFHRGSMVDRIVGSPWAA
ncbi:HD domain-containing protein [Herbiconiux sp. P16]|uniref:HD domain-containing protein n=1 Tax=Herbiconiux wuyangfengii TaxID=3342794 RepID=UPI0035B801FB